MLWVRKNGTHVPYPFWHHCLLYLQYRYRKSLPFCQDQWLYLPSPGCGYLPEQSFLEIAQSVDHIHLRLPATVVMGVEEGRMKLRSHQSTCLIYIVIIEGA